MVELHDHLGAHPAVWVGHDLGSPAAAALAAHHAERCRGLVLVSVPYFPDGFALPNLLPLVDRGLYPLDRFPDGQWDYYRFYLTNFEQTVIDFNANVPGTLAAIYQPGSLASVGKVYRSALVTPNGGWFGSSRHAPTIPPDTSLWTPADFSALVEAFGGHGFRPANAWYLNDPANIAYAQAAPDGGRLGQQVLFVNGDWDAICDITRSSLGEPMRLACRNLEMTNLPSGHWLPLERKTELAEAIRSWLEAKDLYRDREGQDEDATS
jgi:pimeloyl-ACP methyl ester carboxylesterase